VKGSGSLSGDASPSDNCSASMRVGINCLAVEPLFVGGVTTYALGLLEGLASAGNGCRFLLFVTEENQRLFEPFRNCNRFEIAVIGDRLFSLRSKICQATSLSCSKAASVISSSSRLGGNPESRSARTTTPTRSPWLNWTDERLTANARCEGQPTASAVSGGEL